MGGDGGGGGSILGAAIGGGAGLALGPLGAIGGASLGSDPSSAGGVLSSITDPLTGASATQGAIDAQTAATNNANLTQQQIFNQEQQNAAPYQQAGLSGLAQLQSAMPQLTSQFNMSDFQQDPGYQFQLQQGNQALQQSAAAKGQLNSGGTLKALDQYSQGLASQDYQDAYNRFTQSQQQNYGMLSGLANYGQTANGQIASAGQNYANQVSSNDMALGNASASAQIGQANRVSGLIGQGAGVGVAALLSDERLKTDIEPISKTDLDELRSTLKAYKFKYKSEKYGEGNWIGVMAQDLEKSKIGKTLVKTNKEGFKQIDTLKVMCLFLATLAEG